MLLEPPWSRIGRRNAPDLIHQFSKLADPSWIAATMAYIKDISALAEFQKKAPKSDPPPKDHDDDDESAHLLCFASEEANLHPASTDVASP